MAILEFLLAHRRAEVIIATLLATAICQLVAMRLHFDRTQCNATIENFFGRHPAMRILLYGFSSVFLAGMAMNIAVVVSNGGRMPVAIVSDDFREITFDERHCLLTSASRLPFLADIFALEGKQLIFQLSLGDIFIFVGCLCLALLLLFVLVPGVAVAIGSRTTIPQ